MKLFERHDPTDHMDIFSGMTGLEFIFTPSASGLTVEQQSRLIDLADGSGKYFSQLKMNVKWRDMRSLINDLEVDANARSLIGQAVTQKLFD